jgi:nucleotidyltransferase substrate binding protein (TIGR01987 family)
MELPEKYIIELKNFQKAVQSFEKGLTVSFDLDDTGMDLIKNGKIQKFEYCAELVWKVSKMFLELRTRILTNSPKMVYKGLFQSRLIDESHFLALFETIEHRNMLSHIYKEEMYEIVYADLSKHLLALKKLADILASPD